jgi:hypothetical protein
LTVARDLLATGAVTVCGEVLPSLAASVFAIAAWVIAGAAGVGATDAAAILSAAAGATVVRLTLAFAEWTVLAWGRAIRTPPPMTTTAIGAAIQASLAVRPCAAVFLRR